MSRTWRRLGVYCIALTGLMALFALAPAWLPPHLAWMRVAPALVGAGLVAAYALTSDEVERALALNAAGFAFIAALCGLIVLAAIDNPAIASLVVQRGWALLITFWLIGWLGFRVRLG